MANRKIFTAEQIIMKLREAEVLLSQGKITKEACRALEISEQTYYRWRKEYGGLDTTQAKKLKALEIENSPDKRRQAVEQVQAVMEVSERRVCRVTVCVIVPEGSEWDTCWWAGVDSA